MKGEMSMTTFRWTPRVCAALLLVGGLASAGTAATSPVEELTKVLPDDLLLFVATSGGDAVKSDFDKSIMGRIWNDPSTRTFYKAIKTELITRMQREAENNEGDEDIPKQVDMVLDCVQLVLSRPVLFGITRVQVLEGPPVCLFAILDAGARKADLAAAVAKLEVMLTEDEVSEIEVGSLKMHGSKTKDDVPVYWGWVGNYLIIAGNDTQGAVLKHLANPRPATTEYLKKVPGHGDALALYCDFQKTLSLVNALIAEEEGDEDFEVINTVMAELGLANVRAMTARVGFAGPDVVSSALLATPETKRGLFAVYKPVDMSMFGMVDAQAMRAGAFNCDLAGVYDMVMNAIKAASPKTHRDLQKGLAEFELQAQFRIRDGLLKSLAGPVVYSSLPSGRMLEAPMGGFTVVLKLADAPLFEKNLTALGEFAVTKAEGMLQVGSQTDEAGRTLHVWASPMIALMQMMPTWSVVEDYLVFASNTALCKRGVEQVASQGKGAQSLLDTDGFKKVQTRLPKDVLSLTYADSQAQFTQSMTAIQSLWPVVTMLAMEEGVKLPVMLPSLGHIAKDMQPSCEYSYVGPDGFYSCYQGTGIEARMKSMNSGALMAGILMPALARTRQLAFRMTSGTNLSGIGKACLIYANDHEDELPPDLEALVREVELSPKALESKLKPKDFDGPGYIYIAGQTVMMSPRNVVAYDNPAFCVDGVNVLFLDSHVEFMKPDAFREVLKATYKRLSREMPEIKFKD